MFSHPYTKPPSSNGPTAETPTDFSRRGDQSESISPAPAPEEFTRRGGQSDAPPRRGRPRVLDEFKRREICALLAAGCSTHEAARYVGCSALTIRREAAHNPEFKDALRHSEMYAQLNPLRAMQRAVGTNWRAAAWLLERAYPDRYGRRNQSAWSTRQIRDAFAEVQSIVTSEVTDPIQKVRIEKRLRMTLDYLLHAAANSERTSRDLRHALKFLEEKERMSDPLGPLGLKTPDPLDFFKPNPPGKPTARRETSAPQSPNNNKTPKGRPPGQ